ncbi:rootletin-like [Scomber scombrus]|uniref:rootletin-like n=1 Tax=Scomber scombrus TaxID=13677 RepID=UPI002DDC1EF8|nr:rootletin-like [Scomber scombrus]
MIHLKREERDKGLLKVIKDEKQSFEEWFQDLQLSVNECFENPESRTYVEMLLQRLISFIKSKDAERRLDQLGGQLERGSQQIPPQDLSDLTDWLKEQQEEVATFKTHCHNRQTQMESLINDLNSLQKQHDNFCEWLQSKEKLSVESDKVKNLLKNLQDESQRVETLSELLAAVRRQGVRADGLLKDGDNLIQRHRNLEAKLQKQAEAQGVTEELEKFNTQAESTRTWFKDLLQPLTSTDRDFQPEEKKHRAQAVLSSKPEVDSKLNDLIRQSESLCEQEGLEENRKQEVKQSVRDTEEQWKTVMKAAEEALNKAETRELLDKDLDAFKSLNESVQSWIRDQDQNQATLSSKSDGESKLQDLKRQCQSLCDNQDLDEQRRAEVQEAVRHTEEQWKTVINAAKEALNKAETQALLDKDLDAFKTLNESVQSWIRDQDQNLQTLGGHIQAEEKLQIAQATLSSKSDGESKLQDLKGRCQSLCDNQDLDEQRRAEVQEAVRHTEEQWRTVMKAAEEALNKAETEATTEEEFAAFKRQNESSQSWIRERKQKLSSLGGHVPFEERLQIAQAVITSKHEGESKVLDLKRRAERLYEQLEEENRKAEVDQLIKDTEQQWKTVLRAAEQAELRSLSDDFEDQSQNTRSWIREHQHHLMSVGSQTPPEERCHTAESVLSSKPDGDCKVNNLRRRGQSLCDRQEVEESRKLQVQKTVRDTEEEWRSVLHAAKEAEAAAQAQISEETERIQLELREFDTCYQDTGHWLTDLEGRLESLSNQTKAEERLHTAQAITSCKTEGDSKLQQLKSRGQSLCSQDLEEQKKQELQQTANDAEDKWMRVLQDAKKALDQAEKRCALDTQVMVYEVLKEKSRSWLEERQQRIVSLENQADHEQIINSAQTILSSKPEGDSQLSNLRRQYQTMCERDDLVESTRREAERTINDSEEQWRTILQRAENVLKKAEVQYLLSRELEAFHGQVRSTKSWVEVLQKQAKSKESGTHGSQTQIEDRLNTSQAILSSKSKGETEMLELKRRAQSLCDHKELEEDRRREVQETVKDTEEQWRTILQAADDTRRQLEGVLERLVSCRSQRSHAEARLAELQKQTSNLPHVFSWPGLGERRQAMEQARTLLDRCTALAPVLSDLHKQATQLFEITQDPSWSDPSWRTTEESIPALLKDLTEAIPNLEDGILTERLFTQLVEQHEAAQDWLREQVKGLGAPPSDRQGLHSAVNTLKALLQTVDREQREMKDLDAARDSLLSLCTPGGQDALTLEVSHLHDLCDTSEKEVRERLTACEAQLEELDKQLAKRAEGLKERAAALQWELRSLDQALSYSEHQNNITQLQQHWHSLQNCEKSLEGLGVKVHELHKEVKSAPAANELPTEIISVVDSLCQQHDSLKSRLSERQSTCSTNTVSCLTDSLQALQQWNKSKPSESISSVQVTIDEGEKLQAVLQEALSHQQFLTDCVTPHLFDKLVKDGSETLREADMQKTSLSNHLKELDERGKQKLPDIQSSDVVRGNLEEVKTSVVAPPRKNKRSPEKKCQPQQNIPITDQYSSFEDESAVSADSVQAEAKTLKPAGTEDIKSTGAEQIEIEPRPAQESIATQSYDYPEFGQRQPETAVVEQSKIQPPKRKSKSTELPPKPADTEAPQTKEEVEGLSFNDENKSVVTKETKLVPTRRKSKNNGVSTPSKPVVIHDTATDVESSSPDVVTGSTEITIEQKGKLSPPKRASKGQKTSPELATKEATKTMKEPDSGKASPTTQVVPEVTEAVIVAERKPSPTKRKSKSVKASPEISKKEPTETKQEPDSQMSSSTVDVVTKTAEITVVEKGKISPTKRKSKDLKPSPELATKESTEVLKEPDSQKSSDSKEQTEKAVSEVTKLIPTRRKSKGPEAAVSALSGATDLEPKEFKKEPESEKPSSPAQVVTESAIVEEGKLSPTKRKSKSPKASPKLSSKGKVSPAKIRSDSQTTVEGISPICEKSTVKASGIEVIQEHPEKKVVTVILDTSEVSLQTAGTPPQKIRDTINVKTPGLVEESATFVQPIDTRRTPSPHAETLESKPKERSKEAPEQPTAQNTRSRSCTVPQTQPLTDIQYGANYTENLWSNTTEMQKRYLVLDMPGMGFTQTQESTPYQLQTENVAEKDSTQPTSFGLVAVQPHEEETFTEISLSEQTNIPFTPIPKESRIDAVQTVSGNQYMTTADAKPKEPESQKEEQEKVVKLQDVPLPMATATATEEERLQGVDSSQELVCSADEQSLENEDAAETSGLQTEEDISDIPDSQMTDIFVEIQMLAGTGPNSHLIEVATSDTTDTIRNGHAL